MTLPEDAADTSSSSDLMDGGALPKLVDDLMECILRGESIDLESIVRRYPDDASRIKELVRSLDFLSVFRDRGEETKYFSQDAGLTNLTPNPAGIFGDFQILREIGRGGMGIVYEARQLSLDRCVALKVFPFAGVCAPNQLRRFQHEAKAAAGLHHTHIVPVFAFGSDRGLHFYAMQYIEGRSLACLIREWRATRENSVIDSEFEPETSNERKQPLAEKIRNGESVLPATLIDQQQNRQEAIPSDVGFRPAVERTSLADHDSPSGTLVRFRQIAEWGFHAAEALEYAHSLGIVHRDIKPANLLLGSEGKIWVADFGLAQIASVEGMTMSGDLVGTLRYMSPEQAGGSRAILDQRTDVYSLGATLYELLTLTPLFGDCDRASLLERILRSEPVDLRKLNPRVPKELATIVHKAIDRDLSTRYQTAKDLADDLRRFLDDRPIHAKPPTNWDRLRKWVARNRGMVRLGAVFSMMIAVMGSVALWLIDRAQHQVQIAQIRRSDDQRLAATVKRNLDWNQYVTQINLADRAFRLGELAEARGYLADCIPVEGSEDLRRFEWHYLWNATREPQPPFARHEGMAYSIAISPDGMTLATAGQDGVRIWNAQSGQAIAFLTAHSSEVNCVSFSPDGTLLATAGDDQSVRIWSVEDWQVQLVIPHVGPVVAARFVPGQPLIATGERHMNAAPQDWVGEDVVRLWDLASGKMVQTLQRHSDTLQSLDVSPDGLLLASGASDGDAVVWDLQQHRPRYRWKHGFLTANQQTQNRQQTVHCVAFAHRSHHLASAVEDGLVRVWNTDNGELVATLSGSDRRLEFVSFSNEDGQIAAGGNEDSANIWFWNPLIGSRRSPDFVLRKTGSLWNGGFLDERHLITTGRNGTVRKWDFEDLVDQRRILNLPGPANDLDYSRDGTHVLVAGQGIQLVSLLDGQIKCELANKQQSFDFVAVLADGSVIARDGSTQRINRWPNVSSQAATIVSEADLSRLFVTVGTPERFLHWNSYWPAASEQPFASLVAKTSRIDFFTNDRLLSTADRRVSVVAKGDGCIQCWSEGHRKWESKAFTSVGVVALSADGSRIAVAEKTGPLHIQTTDDPESRLKFLPDVFPGLMSISPDGATLAISDSSRIHLLNATTGRFLMELHPSFAVFHLRFSSDGRTLLAAGKNHRSPAEIVVWQAGD